MFLPVSQTDTLAEQCTGPDNTTALSELPVPLRFEEAHAVQTSNIAPAPISASPRDWLGVPGFRARLAQDAHTVWEQIIYDALWSVGTGDELGPKTVCVGYRTLAAHTRLGDKTIKRNLRSLEEKLAISAIAGENSRTNTGRTYHVYSYKQILERRRAAGLEWVIRNRQSVVLTIYPVATVTRGVSDNTGVTKTPVVFVTPGPGVKVAINPVVSMTTQLGNSLGKNETTSAVATQLGQMLREELGVRDPKAVLRIITDCRKQAPNATDNEIVQQTRAQAGRILKMKNIDNPVGMLIATAPNSFADESFRSSSDFDDGRKIEVENTDDVSYWENLACNPDATEEMRQRAREQVKKAHQA